MGALQAQDLTAAKWAIGARVPGSVVADIDDAIASRAIVRSWPMRGTLHLLPSERLRPILAITGPRELRRATTRHRALGIDEALVRHARAIAERELCGGRSLSRAELQAAWEAAGITTTGQRGYHLIWRLAIDAVICWGPVEARGQRIVLLDEWVPGPLTSEHREETLAELLIAYLTGHGPATLPDFAWWSGLTLTDARAARAAAGDALTGFDDARFVATDAGWPADPAAAAPRPRSGLALAAFDEYFLGYADRDPVCDPEYAARIVPGGNGVFQPFLVVAGRVTGTWRAGRARAGTTVELRAFDASSRLDPSVFSGSLRAWADFFGGSLHRVEVA